MSEEDKGVNDNVVSQSTTNTESPTVESKNTEAVDQPKPKGSDSFLAGFDEDQESSEPPEEEELEVDTNDEELDNPELSEEEPEDLKEDKPKSKAEERKQKVNQEIRDLVAERNRLAQEVSQMEELQPPTLEELMEAGYSEAEARLRLIEEKDQIREAQAQVANLRLNMTTDRLNLLNDFPVFDSESPDFDEDFARKAATLYAQSAQVEYDQQGNVISATQPLYQFLANLAELRESGEKVGRVRAQKTTDHQLSATAAKSSVRTPPPAKDSFLEGFNKDEY